MANQIQATNEGFLVKVTKSHLVITDPGYESALLFDFDPKKVKKSLRKKESAKVESVAMMVMTVEEEKYLLLISPEFSQPILIPFGQFLHELHIL